MSTTAQRALFLALLVAAVLGPFSAPGAQCPPPPPESPLAPGEIGLFFDAQGTITCAEPGVGVPTPLYVVVRVPDGGIAEFAVPEIMPTEALPAGMILVAASGIPQGIPYDPLIVIDDCSRARRSDPATCPVSPGDLLVIAVAQVMLTAPVRDTACFQTGCSTIAGPRAGATDYARCDTGASGTFTGWDDLCIGFGVQVPVEATTWGAVKALYTPSS
jgi:hypothetical protein